MKQRFLKAQFVQFIPESLEDGVIYVSRKYGTATHRCCCGCGQEVVTPIGPTNWSLQVTGGAVTLYPSIGNWSLPCRSHYWIRNGGVEWAGTMSAQEVQRGRIADQRIRDRYFAEANRQKEINAPWAETQTGQTHGRPDWMDRAWQYFKLWFGA
ncbi:MAG: DUF6527 family protein [Hyphomicrobium sp.]